MTEAEWNASTEPDPMLRPARFVIRKQPRKGYLFAVACCDRIRDLLTDQRSRAAIEMARRCIEGTATAEDLAESYQAAEVAHREAIQTKGKIGATAAWAAQFAASPEAFFAASRASNFAYVTAAHGLAPRPECAAQADLLRCIFGPLPFRDIQVDPAWLKTGGRVAPFARIIDREQSYFRLAELADLLEEAGCRDSDILGHCRSDKPHVRGCWVVDLLLQRSHE